MRQRAENKLDKSANAGRAPIDPACQKLTGVSGTSCTSKITFNPDDKFDLQLSDALIAERRLANIFENLDLHLIELKTETWQWEQTGNICIEYSQNGQPSGIAKTEAGCWVHELRRDGRTLCYLMFPIERLKELARHYYANGGRRKGGGDGGRFCNIVIPLKDILR